MRLGVAWTVLVVAANLWFHRYGAAFAQLCVGSMTYGLVKMVMWTVDHGERQARGPRLILRDDGRVCVTRSVRPWYKPVETCCGEQAKPREVLDPHAAATCIACIAAS